MLTLLYKNKIFCIFLNSDYDLFTKIYYLCTEFQKHCKYTINF